MGCGASSEDGRHSGDERHNEREGAYADETKPEPQVITAPEDPDQPMLSRLESFKSTGYETEEASSLKMKARYKFHAMKGYIMHGVDSDPNQTVAQVQVQDEADEPEPADLQRVATWVDQTICETFMYIALENESTSFSSHAGESTNTQGSPLNYSSCRPPEDSSVEATPPLEIEICVDVTPPDESRLPPADTPKKMFLGGPLAPSTPLPTVLEVTLTPAFMTALAGVGQDTDDRDEEPDTIVYYLDTAEPLLPKNSPLVGDDQAEDGNDSSRSNNGNISLGAGRCWEGRSTQSCASSSTEMLSSTGSLPHHQSTFNLLRPKPSPDPPTDVPKPSLTVTSLKQWKKLCKPAVKAHLEEKREGRFAAFLHEYTPEDLLQLTHDLQRASRLPPLPTSRRYYECMMQRFMASARCGRTSVPDFSTISQEVEREFLPVEAAVAIVENPERHILEMPQPISPVNNRPRESNNSNDTL